MGGDVPVLFRYMEIQMTIEELKAKREIAYAFLDVLDEEAGYREMFYAYRQAFEHVDDALTGAISHLEEYRKVIYPGPDRDILNPRS